MRNEKSKANSEHTKMRSERAANLRYPPLAIVLWPLAFGCLALGYVAGRWSALRSTTREKEERKKGEKYMLTCAEDFTFFTS